MHYIIGNEMQLGEEESWREGLADAHERKNKAR